MNDWLPVRWQRFIINAMPVVFGIMVVALTVVDLAVFGILMLIPMVLWMIHFDPPKVWSRRVNPRDLRPPAKVIPIKKKKD